MTANERQQHADKLRTIKQRRLDELELQAAVYGVGVPAAIAMEIDQLKLDLAALEPVTSPTPSDDVKDLLKRYNYMEYWQDVLAGALQRLTALEQGYHADKTARETRQRKLDGWLLLLTGLVIAAIVFGVLR